MKKKSILIVLTLLAFIFISSNNFATSDLKNDMNSATNTVIDGAGRLGNDVKNGVQSAAGAIEDGAKDLGNTISNGMQNMGNTVSNITQNQTTTSNNQYTATRTTASDITNTSTMNSNIWTWIAIAVAGAVIVGLVWYYAVEHDTRER